MMTRKDYIAVSNILKEYKQAMFAEDYVDIVHDFANYMRKDNDRFDSARFAEACDIPKVEYPAPKSASHHVALTP
jgi:hypothetical protein